MKKLFWMTLIVIITNTSVQASSLGKYNDSGPRVHRLEKMNKTTKLPSFLSIESLFHDFFNGDRDAPDHKKTKIDRKKARTGRSKGVIEN